MTQYLESILWERIKWILLFPVRAIVIIWILIKRMQRAIVISEGIDSMQMAYCSTCKDFKKFRFDEKTFTIMKKRVKHEGTFYSCFCVKCKKELFQLLSKIVVEDANDK